MAEKDILDRLEEVNPNKYTNKAYRQLQMTFLFSVAVILLDIGLGYRDVISTFEFIAFSFLVCGILGFSLIGLINSIKSFKEQEEKSFRKYIALVGNILLLIIFLFLTIPVFLPLLW